MFKRIDKRRARKMYNNGDPVIIIPCKVGPGAVWFSGLVMLNDPENTNRDFDSYVNEFEFFNCCAELGSYAAFYITV